MANIREYNMNGTLILGIDYGYGNIKAAHRVFPTALIKSEKGGQGKQTWKPFYSGRNQTVYAGERAEAGGIQAHYAGY